MPYLLPTREARPDEYGALYRRVQHAYLDGARLYRVEFPPEAKTLPILFEEIDYVDYLGHWAQDGDVVTPLRKSGIGNGHHSAVLVGMRVLPEDRRAVWAAIVRDFGEQPTRRAVALMVKRYEHKALPFQKVVQYA